MLPSQYSRFSKLILTALFIALLGYGYYEARAMLFGPRIIIDSAPIVTHEAFILIKGRAENITDLRLNGAPISVTEDGQFSEPYLASAGENYIVLDAKDRFERASSRSIEVIYVPDKPASPFSATTTTEQHSTTTKTVTPVP